jgi:hypothetical protein
MADPTTTTGQQAARCRKHAFAPSARFRPRNGPVGNVTLPAQRHNRRLRPGQLASETSVAGDDPVNQTDPSGLWSHGYCLSGSGEILAVIAAASGTVCAVQNYQSQPALLTSVSAGILNKPQNLGDFLTDLDSAVENGLGAASVTASFYIAFTDSLQAQTGQFGSYFGSIGIGKYLSVQGTYFYGDGNGNGKCGTTPRGGTTGGLIGISAGVAWGIPIPVSGGSSVYDMKRIPLSSKESFLIHNAIQTLDILNPLASVFNAANSIQENV